jgi:hypothetical protein
MQNNHSNVEYYVGVATDLSEISVVVYHPHTEEKHRLQITERKPLFPATAKNLGKLCGGDGADETLISINESMYLQNS